MYRQRSNEKQFRRANENQRSSRGYEINGQWYFELRGGGQKGPFDTELQMRASLNEFIKFHNQMRQSS